MKIIIITKHKKMKYIATILFLVLSLTLSAQTRSAKNSPPLVDASPESVGMSSERLARIDVMCEKAVSEGDIPGVVALVARHGKIIYWKAFGMADNRSGRSLKKNDIFRIASMSKPITSTAAMMLWEEGKFTLDDPVSKYIPEFKNPQVLKQFSFSDTSYTTVAANCEITIRHLLTHTSGLGYGQIDKDERFKLIYQKAGITDLFTTEDISIGENVRKLAKLPLHHNPGENYTYSEGLDVIGYLIEVVSGMPYDEFLRKRLFEPLGMNDTWFYLPGDEGKRLVSLQHPTDDGKWDRYPVTFYDPDYPVKGAKRFFSGGAGLCSTAKDYATFLQMYLNGGELNGIRILSRTTIQSMLCNQIGDLRGENFNRHYGLAFSITNEIGQADGGMGSVGSLAAGGYFNTQSFADPKEGYIGVLMKQTRKQVSDDTGWMFRLLTGQAVDD
jgi:CubicO group peptidase (beta-lactamase class C family)